MPKYKFWYYKEIEANNIAQAVKKEKLIPLEFESIINIEEPEYKIKTSAIGFEYNPVDDED